MKLIKDVYKSIAETLIQNSKEPRTVETSTIYRIANKGNREILNQGIISKILHPQSGILNFETFERFAGLSAEGRSCLIAMEHYSNFDLPNFLYLIDKEIRSKLGSAPASANSDRSAAEFPASAPNPSPAPANSGSNPNPSTKLSDRIISIAGMKLNTESDFVRAFTEAYTRIIIYPSRSLTPLLGNERFSQEWLRSQEINKQALRTMNRLKHEQNMILVFPTGTRYRPNVPNSRRGLAEIDSYLRNFEYFIPVAIAGNTLLINEDDDMSKDFVNEDCVIYNVGNIIESKKWRSDLRSLAPEDLNTKQFVVDCLMDLLIDLHRDASAHREKCLASKSL